MTFFSRRALASLAAIIAVWCAPLHAAPKSPIAPILPLAPVNQLRLTDQVQARAWRFFREKSDAATGLTQDRAKLDGSDDFAVASMAATGFALAALPVAVEHHWTTQTAARAQALKTLRFVSQMPDEHGFLFHFVDKRSGARAWNSEVSSIDSGLFLCGALVAGAYFGGEVQDLAAALYDRADWNWLLTNGGAQPDKLRLSHGWKPESGFLPYDYGWSEASLIYLLALGSPTHPIGAASWRAMGRPVVSYGGLQTLAGGPIFVQQMPLIFFDMKNKRDDLGYDYWVSATHSIEINRLFCSNNAPKRASYGADFWGLNAGDAPDGYAAFGAPDGPENGTLSPTGVFASLPFAPALTLRAGRALYRDYGARLWGRYGFGNAYNVDRAWFDDEVIGIDLGMALLSIENARGGLVWRLMNRQAATRRAFEAIGLRETVEAQPRALRVE